MPGRNSGLNPLEARKQLLLVESEVHRLMLAQEGRAIARHVGGFAADVKKVGNVVSSIAAGVAAVSDALRPGKETTSDGKPSWFQSLKNGFRAGSNLWSAFRGRQE
jgi:hypothetical protein